MPAKIETVFSARKRGVDKYGRQLPQHSCFRCEKPIEPGQSYKWYKADRSSQQISWHSDCQPPSRGEMESNPKRATAYFAVDGLDDEVAKWSSDDVGDLISAVETAVGQLEEAQGMWEESADNIEDGFGHETSASEQQREYASLVEDAARSLDDAKGDLLTYDEWASQAVEYDTPDDNSIESWSGGR